METGIDLSNVPLTAAEARFIAEATRQRWEQNLRDRWKTKFHRDMDAVSACVRRAASTDSEDPFSAVMAPSTGDIQSSELPYYRKWLVEKVEALGFTVRIGEHDKSLYISWKPPTSLPETQI